MRAVCGLGVNNEPNLKLCGRIGVWGEHGINGRHGQAGLTDSQAQPSSQAQVGPCRAGNARAGHHPSLNTTAQTWSSICVADTSGDGSIHTTGPAHATKARVNEPDGAALAALLEHPAANPGRFEAVDAFSRGGGPNRPRRARRDQHRRYARVDSFAPRIEHLSTAPQDDTRRLAAQQAAYPDRHRNERTDVHWRHSFSGRHQHTCRRNNGSDSQSHLWFDQTDLRCHFNRNESAVGSGRGAQNQPRRGLSRIASERRRPCAGGR